ncbi:MAG: DMT family transporter [Tabrizicola sp.]|uniref:DMT family transporter n=1 Tax=Tabrizicola sp. TaxID=2005166 RepID=UPI002AB8C915|nr:DMT family transporter [Tabrizicola sp.]MDZ4088548.1 DMT family transporter [Tabrizicola sp.]
MRLFLLTALTMLAFAANSVLNRWAVGPGHIGAVEFAMIRLVAGAAMLAVLVLWQRGGLAWPGARGRLAGVLGLSVYLIGFSLAYRGLDAGTGALVLFGMVQVTMFAGALVSREAVPGRRWAGAGLALGGLVLIAAPGAVAAVPLALMAAAGVGWGVYSLAGRGAVDPLAATAWNFLLSVPLVLPLGLLAGVALPDVTGVALAIVSGAVTSGLGYALWYAILPRLGAGRAAVAQLTVPVIAALGGAVLLAELPGVRFWLATVLVLGGVALASLPYRSRTIRSSQ